MDPFDLFGFMGPIVAISLLLPLLMTGLIVGVIVWAIRRNSPRREDPAIEALKIRLARGEIDPVEYEVRLRALHDGDG
jgi:uncharacterized membrane protein